MFFFVFYSLSNSTMKLHRINIHFKRHHKKYVGWLFAGFALVKTFVLLVGFFGLINIASTFAAEPDNSIISKYYGPNSEYTSNWINNACNYASMSVQYITPWMDNIPATLNQNTIYVLNSWAHITSRSIHLANCSAIVGTWDAILYSNDFQNDAILSAADVSNFVIDAIKIDWANDGRWLPRFPHSSNSVWIQAVRSSNNTISHTQVYNHRDLWISISSGHNNTFNIVQVHNNDGDWIGFANSSNNTLNNLQSYNNGAAWISFFLHSNNNIINNSLTYNNFWGLLTREFSNSNVINNIQAYNNFQQWVIIATNSSGTIINNIYSYNNGEAGLLNDTTATNTKFYWNLKLFSNTHSQISGSIISWSVSDFSGFFSTWIFDAAGTMSCDWVTNPMYTNWMYLIDINAYHTCDVKWPQGTSDSSITHYVYWVNMVIQKQPLKAISTGNFSLFSLSTLVWNPNQRLADINTFAQSDSMIDFYYGPSSVYTTNRTGNICNPGEMTVEYINPGTDTIPASLSGNTLYVLLSWSHITSRQIDLATCSAIIGSGDVTIYSTGEINSMLEASTKENVIVDNIKIDWLHDGSGGEHVINTFGIRVVNSSNSTINNFQTHDSLRHGIFIYGSPYITISNSKSYDNGEYGIYVLSSSHNTTISNSQSYNNNGFWIMLGDTNHTTIDNVQTYNNINDGINLFNSSDNTISDSQFYNNINGVNLQSSSNNNTINNSQSYNNSEWIFINTCSILL